MKNKSPLLLGGIALAACSVPEGHVEQRPVPGSSAEIYPAASAVTMSECGTVEAVAIRDGKIIQVRRAGELGAGISAASHYIFYLGEAYQSPLGPERGSWLLPLASLSAEGVPVTLHSDAPLAPPLPLRAASVHLLRSTREGSTLTSSVKLSPEEALQSITIDAAFALGLETELGSIEPGKLADFTILSANPLETAGEDWDEIAVWGVVIGGEKRPLID